MFFIQVCGVEALRSFSKQFLSPYQPAVVKGSLEELEVRVSTLKQQLEDAEAELGMLKKGEQKV